MFSGAVKLLDLNDYIRPGEECVVRPAPAAKAQLLLDGAQGGKTTVSLADCLACSGCITTAEALLVEEQSLAALLATHAAFRFRCALVSAQSLAALALAWELSLEQAFAAVTLYFHSLGFDAVFDTQAFVQLINVRALAEFRARGEATLLCSECPGWVCYLEKTLGAEVVALASAQKPPQLIQAEALRGHLARVCGAASGEVFVALVAPCFDKKLEASREEGRKGAPVINLVLSTEELRAAAAPSQLPDSATEVLDSYELCRALLSDRPWVPFPLSRLTLRRPHLHHGSSNGYLDFLLRNCFGPEAAISATPRRNRNFMEVRVVEGDRETLFALVYGFKNIQNLVRDVRQRKCKYAYVEVMACPGGCAGGGGQVPGQSAESVLEKMNELASIEDDQRLLVEELARRSGCVPESSHHYAIAPIPKSDTALNW